MEGYNLRGSQGDPPVRNASTSELLRLSNEEVQRVSVAILTVSSGDAVLFLQPTWLDHDEPWPSNLELIPMADGTRRREDRAVNRGGE